MKRKSVSIRVVVIDDHEVVRQGVRMLLDRAGDIAVCGEAEGLEDGVALVQKCEPDVAVVDLRLRDSSGVDVVRQLRAKTPTTGIVMMTAFTDDRDGFVDSIKEGASAYVLKDSDCSELIKAIRAVAQGLCYLDPTLHMTVFEYLRASTSYLPAWSRDVRLSRLSVQERRVLSLIAAGATNDEIGRSLGISSKTAKNHTTRILSKLELKNRGQAAAYLASLV